ncbi:NAD(P)-dependent oxidoreductase [Luteibacter sp. CQ10]|uniref:NAD(P)-dependent oxidoreductase n=1 Tax=Luteibacter sp. CQ10 TaxID=2805821 RepID=UPI0034A20B3F
MKIVLFGATGNIGRVILDEALSRGHEVIAVVRDPSKITARDRLRVVKGDVTDAASLASPLTGADAAIASLNGDVRSQSKALLAAVDSAGVRRFAWVGGAGSLETAPGVRVIDDPNFPEAWKANATAQAEVLDAFRAADARVDWTYVSPSKVIAPGERKGTFRVGGDRVLKDASGESFISIADFAIGVLDRIEKGDAPKQRVTFGY